MMSTSQIVEASRRAAVKAARQHKKPYIFEEEDREAFLNDQVQLPSLGSYVPKGWEMVDHFLVDSSGCGSEGELAYTFRTFVKFILKPGMGYAIIEAGEFQVVVGEFKQLPTYRKDKACIVFSTYSFNK